MTRTLIHLIQKPQCEVAVGISRERPVCPSSAPSCHCQVDWALLASCSMIHGQRRNGRTHQWTNKGSPILSIA